MLFSTKTHQKECIELQACLEAKSADLAQSQSVELSEQEIRRQMYARIARGNALAEVEEQAHQARR